MFSDPSLVLVRLDRTQRRAEEAPRADQARLTCLAYSSLVGILVADRSETISDVNDTFLRMVGYSRDEVLSGRVRCHDLTPEEWRQADTLAFEQLEAHGVATPWEKEITHRDGSRISVYVVAAMLDDTKWICFVHDLTELKREDAARKEAAAAAREQQAGRVRAEAALEQVEVQLRQAQKMEAIGSLAGGIAHDFNNILSVILGYSEVLAADLEDGDPMREDLAEIGRAGLRASTLTRQLLAFSRQQVLQPTTLNLNDVIANMAKMLGRLIGEDMDLTIRAGADLMPVNVDPSQVEQVLMNLVVNARDAMPSGGKITIATANVDLEEQVARHAGVTPGPHVMVSVSDVGCGMDEQTQARVFEPFFTTKEKGTGLGLAVVFGIVSQSGGSIRVHSEPGQGSTFTIYFPQASRVEKRTTLSSSKPGRGTETILLVEDEEQVRNLTRTILRRNGYRVLEAASGGDALLACEQHDGPIHLLLTDVVLPRMNGRELAERLAAARPEMKVLFISGYTDDAVVRRGVLSSTMAFFQKPIVPNALLAKLREVIDGPRRA